MAVFTSGEPERFPETQGFIFDLIAERVRRAVGSAGIYEYEMFGEIEEEGHARERAKASVKSLASNIFNARVTKNNPYLIPTGRIGDLERGLSLTSDAIFWGRPEEVDGYAYGLFRAIATDALNGAATDEVEAAFVDRMNEWSEFSALWRMLERVDQEWFDGIKTTDNFLFPAYESIEDDIQNAIESAILWAFRSVRSEFSEIWYGFVRGKTTSKLHKLLLSFSTDELIPLLARTRDSACIGRLGGEIVSVILDRLPSENEFVNGCLEFHPLLTASEEPFGAVMEELISLSRRYLKEISDLQRRIDGDPLDRSELS